MNEDLNEIMRDIASLKYAYSATFCPYYKTYFIKLLNKRLTDFYNELYFFALYSRQEQLFTKDELAKYDGSHGRPAYIAVSGIVYDVSLQPAWGGGSHFSVTSGRDLSDEFKSCHDNQAILDKLPVVGKIK